MHIDFLIEDTSCKILINSLLCRLIDVSSHTYNLLSYHGIGQLPSNITSALTAKSTMLLNDLPRMLRALSRSRQGVSSAVVVIVDLDKRNQQEFEADLRQTLSKIANPPKTVFCLAIEEAEAWLLGDINAIKKAYPRAKNSILRSYVNDSICDTWELMADAIYKGGAKALKEEPYFTIGEEKCKWAENIAPYMDIDNNQSPSFQFFRDSMRALCAS